MTLTAFEAAARLFETPARAWSSPGELAQHLDRRILQTPALELIDQALVNLVDTSDGRLALSMPPQEGKSQRVSRWFPLWALLQNPDLRIAIVSYELGVARRWGRAIRDELTTHPELGLKVRDDLAAQHEWQIATCATCWTSKGDIPEGAHRGHEGGVYSAGIGGALTGRPVDLLIIDDPVKDREQADSEVYRERAWDWWTDTGSTRLAPGAPAVIVATRWHEEDLTGKLLEAGTTGNGDVFIELNIPAQADHDPAKGETDPLGRKVGEFMESARRRTKRQWEAIKRRVGSRTWASLYQGRPSPASGDIWLREWWQRYDQPHHLERADGARIITGYDDILMSWDLTFKDTKGSDFVVGQVWIRRGADAYLLDQVRGRWDFVETCRQFEAFSARWPQAVLKVVEDKANGPAVIAALKRRISGIVPEEPQGSKLARASAVAPLIEAGNVHVPVAGLAPWADDLIEEAAGFPNASHDDMVDATSQALNRLLVQPLLAGTDLEHPDFEDELDDDMAYLDTAI